MNSYFRSKSKLCLDTEYGFALTRDPLLIIGLVSVFAASMSGYGEVAVVVVGTRVEGVVR